MNKKTHYLIGWGAGLAIGIAIGTSLNNSLLGIGVGIALGAALGEAPRRKDASTDEEILKKQNEIFLDLFNFTLGCYNNPTPPSEITGAMVSGVLYKQLDCEALNEEIIFLEGREKELVMLQEYRISESRSQQVWANGSGKGRWSGSFRIASS